MNTITSAPNVINCGNTSIANLKIREQMKNKTKMTGEIFAKLDKRGKLNPKQNAMNYQLTNEQLFRFYCDEVMPKLQQSNETTAGDPSEVLKKEIQRLLTVGDTQSTDLVKLLQASFTSLSADVATAGTATPSAADIAAAIAGVLPAPVAPAVPPAAPSAADIGAAIAAALAGAGIGGGGGGGVGGVGVASASVAPLLAPTLAGVASGITSSTAASTAGGIMASPAAASPSSPTASPIVMSPLLATPTAPTLDMEWKTRTVRLPATFIDTKTDTVKKPAWPVLQSDLSSKGRWIKIIPSLATASNYANFKAVVALFKAEYPTPNDFYIHYKILNPNYEVSQLKTMLAGFSPTPSPAGALSAAPTAAGAAGGGGVLAAGVGGAKTLVFPQSP